MKKTNNMYHYCVIYHTQCKKAKKNGHCGNADKEICKYEKRLMERIMKMPVY